ncbi:MAG: DUF4173 domain-containing protein [Microthrixaceae bacterium]
MNQPAGTTAEPAPPSSWEPPPERPPANGAPRARARWSLAAVLATALLVDLALQTRASGVAAFVAVAVTAVGLLSLGSVGAWLGRILVTAALVPAAFLPLRASAWLTAPNLVAVSVLLALGAGFAHQRSLRHAGFPRLIGNLLLAVGGVILAPEAVTGTVRSAHVMGGGRTRPVAVWRGMAMAAPLVVTLGLLFASADAMFASLFHLSIDVASVLAHVAVVALVSLWAMGLLVHARNNDLPPATAAGPRLGATESILVLSGLVAVTLAFAGARVAVALNGADFVTQRTGESYASYARSGFFQLLWASGLVLVVLLVLRSVTELPSPRARRAFQWLSVACVALMLVVVQTGVGRLALYERAFGSTMLRLYCTVFAWWVGAVLVMVATAVLTRRGAAWLTAAVMASALLVLTGLNLANPERIVTERNTERTADFDVDYALSLSDDSVPVLVESLPRLGMADRAAVLGGLCRERAFGEPLRWNLAAVEAERSLAGNCG